MATIGLSGLMGAYSKLQSQVMQEVSAATQNISSTQPGQFLLLQFMMGTVSQAGQSISNLVSQVQTMISKAVQNQKS
jgi:hypothetical protein